MNNDAFNNLVDLIKDNGLYFIGEFEVSNDQADSIARDIIERVSNGKYIRFAKTPSAGVEHDAYDYADEYLESL